MRARVAVATVTGLAMLVSAGVLLSRLVTTELPILEPVGPPCVVTGVTGEAAGTEPVDVAMGVSQLANAATISAVGIRRGVPQRAVVIALATALQESKLENLTYGDRDSLGLFQQRPSSGWGRPDQVNDPRYAANAFYSALLKVRHWERMRVTDAAQAVQRSAHPELYEQWAPNATVLANALTGAAPGAVTCTIEDRPQLHGLPAAQALASDLQLDWGKVDTVGVGQPPGVAVAVAGERAGWQYAHWLVAHAERHGVKRVRFGDQEWTARRATWDRVAEATPSAAGRVLAEVSEA